MNKAPSQNAFGNPIKPNLSLVIVGQLNYDAYPAGTDVPQFTLYSTTGLSWQF